MSFVTVRSFDNYIDANITLAKLQQEDIHCVLQDEYTVTIDPILTNAIGGIKLVVPVDEQYRAKKLLEQFDAEKREVLKCPQCGSHNIELITNPKRSGNWLGALLSFSFASYAVSIKKTYRCFDCGFETENLEELQPAE